MQSLFYPETMLAWFTPDLRSVHNKLGGQLSININLHQLMPLLQNVQFLMRRLNIQFQLIEHRSILGDAIHFRLDFLCPIGMAF